MKPEELVEAFELFDDWEDRYRYIIDLGNKLEPLPEDARVEQNLVPGCLSRVWLIAKGAGPAEPIEFRADSDSVIVKGLIGILFSIYQRKTPPEVLAVDYEDLFQSLGLGEHVTMNRRNGFYSMIGKIRQYAVEQSA